MARAPKITWNGLEAALAAGIGTGFGESYSPPLQIKRWNPSPISVQVVKSVPPFKRECHFFSHSEWLLALLFSWLGAFVREQFPMWPWPHQHPEYSRRPEIDATLPWSSGMQAICRDIGIKHGVFIGTNIPYVWTIDIALTLPWIDDAERACCFVSVKPLESERYLYIDPLDRGPEKLEGERRYAETLGISYFVADRSLFPGPLFGQLEYLAEAAALAHDHPLSTLLNRFLDAHSDDLASTPLTDVMERLKRDFGATTAQSIFLLNHMLWNQLIDCDISHWIKTSLPPRAGGRRLKETLRASLQGAIK